MADNINISPEMINNIMNIIKNSSNEDKSENNDNTVNSNNNLGDILSNFTSNADQSQNNTNDNNTTNNSENSIDFETILKIKSIMEALNNKNDPRTNLLYSLKPYLRSSKRSKLDQYANLLKITQVTNLFKNEKGESN